MKKKYKAPKAPLTAAQRKKRRAILIIAAVALAIVAAVVAYLLLHYRFNTEYLAFLPEKPEIEAGTEFKAQKAKDGLPGYGLVTANGTLELYAKEETGEIAVRDLRNGNVVYSNPPAADDDPLANKTNKNNLKSQLLLDYYNASKTSGTYDSFSWSTDRGQMSCEAITDGVRFIYDVGSKTTIDYFVPTYLTKEKYDEYHDALTAQAEELEDQSQQAADESEAKKLHRAALQATADANFVEAQYNKGAVNGNGMVELIPATAMIKNPPQPKGNRAKLFGILEPLGLNEDVYWEQMELGGIEEADDMGFVVAVEYRLRDDALEVSVPMGMVQESGGGKISMISLLPYLGAAGSDETGYMVLPNGSGALINFNNGKQATSAIYNQYIYDNDLVDADLTQIQNTVPARLALYGICRQETGILATIESGASLAHLTSDVSGRSSSYNYCYPVFKVRGDTSMEMYGAVGTGGNEMHLIEDELYDTTLTVRYTLLTEEHRGYSGLANYYRDRLIAEGALTPKAAGGDIPFYYDIIGGVKETAHAVGVQYLHVLPMTTFDEARDIAETLRQNGITNQKLNFQGWFNGGYYQDVADRIKVLRQLGGKTGLEALNDALALMGGELFADVSFQKVTAISKRYIANFEGARDGAGYLAEFGLVNPTTLRRTSGLGYEENYYTLVSPRFLHRYVQAFAKKIANVDVDGVSLRDLGWELHADKRRNGIISREEALSVVKAQLETIANTGRSVLLNDANDYAFGAAGDIINAPMTATGYFIQDGAIPLYQMILHGCVDYAGSAVNTAYSDDWRSEYLKMIEYGASCHYTFTAREASDMKYTALNVFTSTTFDSWAEDAVRTYEYLNGALAPVSGATMTEHAKLSDTLSRVRYSNGATIYVNYADTPAQADGVTVPARDYLMVGGEAQ